MSSYAINKNSCKLFHTFVYFPWELTCHLHLQVLQQNLLLECKHDVKQGINVFCSKSFLGTCFELVQRYIYTRNTLDKTFIKINIVVRYSNLISPKPFEEYSLGIQLLFL